MLRFTTLFSVLTLMSLALWTAGCGSKDDKEIVAKPAEGQGEHDHGSHDHGAAADPDKIATNLAKLSAEDRTAAEKQKICPVSGDLLGAMGAPIKLEVEGRTVFLCCKGCTNKMLKDPKTYLAKLDGGDDHGDHGDHKH